MWSLSRRLDDASKQPLFDYNPTSLPLQFHDKHLSDFLEDFAEQPLHHLVNVNKTALVRICELLSPKEFVRLSLCCRYLHWRMFSLCQSVIPKAKIRYLRDDLIVYIPKRISFKLNEKYVRFQSAQLMINKWDKIDYKADLNRLLKLRQRIDRLGVRFYNPDMVDTSWDAFLKKMRADCIIATIKNSSELLTNPPPFVRQMEYVKILLNASSALKLEGVKLNHPYGHFLYFPTEFIKEQMRKSLIATEEISYKCHVFQVEEEEMFEIATYLGEVLLRQLGEKLVFMKEETGIHLDFKQGRVILSRDADSYKKFLKLDGEFEASF